MVFLRVVDAEWTKLRTVRSTVWTPVLLVAAILGLAALVGITRSLQQDDTILGGSLTGAAVGLLGVAAFGAVVMSVEYGSGMIETTLVACPSRLRLLEAKVLVTSGVSFLVGLVGCAGGYMVGLAMLSGSGYASGSPWPALLGIAGTFAVSGVLGLALGAILRHPAGSVACACAVILVPSLVGPMFGSWGRWAAGGSPMAVLQKLAQSSDAVPEAVGSLGAWPSLGFLVAYAAAALLVAAWLIERRDA